MRNVITAIVAALLCAGSASADLTGTTMTMSVNHAGPFAAISAINNVTYTYGLTSNFLAPGWGTLNVTSPAAAPGMQNAIKLDFTAFAYQSFAGQFATTGTVKILNLVEPFDLSSVKLLVNGTNIALGPATATGNGFQASWNTQTVITGNPTNPNVVAAWNSAPAPGALALLGAAGLVARRRRRT